MNTDLYANTKNKDYPETRGVNSFFMLISDKNLLNMPVNDAGHTWLHVASIKNNMPFTEYLLDRGVDPRVKDKSGAAPLHYASALGHNAILQLMLTVDTFLKDFTDNNGDTPLHIAVLKNNKEGAQLLIAEESNINALNKKGFAPIHLASFNNNLDLINILFEKGVKVKHENAKDYSALHIASAIGNLDTSKALIEYQANVNLREKTLEWASIDFAKLAKHREVIELLLKNGAKDEGTVLTPETVNKFVEGVKWVICNDDGGLGLIGELLPAMAGLGYKALADAGAANAGRLAHVGENVFNADHVPGAIATTLATYVLKLASSNSIKNYRETYCVDKTLDVSKVEYVTSLAHAAEYITHNTDTYLALDECSPGAADLKTFNQLESDWHLCGQLNDATERDEL